MVYQKGFKSLSHEKYSLHNGNCLEVMPQLEENSIDSIVTDPPYGLEFMGKDWDKGVPGVHFWKEMLRAAKPGAHLLAFGGTRTFHRMACFIEDAGWEIRDTVMWVYGSGFPKSLNVSKAIDKIAGSHVPELIPTKAGNTKRDRGNTYATKKHSGFTDISLPVTEEAKQWDGWGTCLKPAYEPIIVARKPLISTVAENVIKYGTGAINIDACRISLKNETNPSIERRKSKPPHNNVWADMRTPESYAKERPGEQNGRFPANFIHDGSDEVVGMFPRSSTTGKRSINSKERFDFESPLPGSGNTNRKETEYTDSGSAARFFYCAKVSRSERDAGLDDIPIKHIRRNSGGEFKNNSGSTNSSKNGAYLHNHHPTVKPIALMRYLCRLVTPPNGIVLDPFMGSGSTGIAAVLENFRFIGIEQDEDYINISAKRIAYHLTQIETQLKLNL